jgi:hypothetical protein
VTSSAKSPFQKRLEKKHAFLFIEHWKEGERPFNWIAEWEHLSVKLSDVSFAISENIALQAFGSDEGKCLTLWNEQDSRDSDVAERVTDEVAALYAKFRSRIFNHSFLAPESEQSIVLTATFTTEETRSIGFIKDGDDGDKQQVTNTGRLMLYSSAERRPGYIWMVDEDEYKWGSSDPVGTVCINVYMPFAQVLRLQAQLKEPIGDGLFRRIQAQLSVLAFQSEVERSLAEPYHSQTYSFSRGSFSPVMLQGTSISERSEPTATSKSARSKLPQTNILSLPEKSKAPSNEQSGPVRGTKALVAALWAIAIAILIHAIAFSGGR